MIIPARDAADTIVETLMSVQEQTFKDWHAVVVDDGSTDTTAELVARVAAADPRIVMIPGPLRGVGAARNAGIRAATTSFVSFLDADDLLSAPYLERMLPPLGSASVAATYTGWQRLAPDGSAELGPCPEVDGDLFDFFAAACAFPPHACVIRRSVVDDVGGFDEEPTTTEDWDFWQRIARTGARFMRVPGALVTYRMRPGSRSRDSGRVLRDGLAVIARGHAADPRVRRSHPDHATGRATELLGRSSYNHASWAGGMALAFDDNPGHLLIPLAGLRAPDLDPWEIGGTMLEAMRVTLCAPKSLALTVVAPRADKLLDFLAALEDAAHAPDLARRTARTIDHLITQQAAPVRPCSLVTSHLVAVELAEPIVDPPQLPARIIHYVAHLTYGGEPIGEVEIPVLGGRVDRMAIVNAAADAAGWRVLEQFLSHTVFPALSFDHTARGLIVRRGSVAVVPDPVASSANDASLFEAVGWTIFVQELFGMAGRSLTEIYASTSPTVVEPVRWREPVLEFDITDTPHDVQTDTDSVIVRCTVGGAPLGDVVVLTDNGMLAAGSIRHALVELSPNELVRLAVRKGIIGWPVTNDVPLRARIASQPKG